VARTNNQSPRIAGEPRRRFAFLSRVESHIQGKTLGGLMELVPLLVTVIVITFIIGYTDGFVRSLGLVSGRPWDFPGVGLIACIVVLYLAGLAIATYPGRKGMDLIHVVLNKIPVVKTVYSVTQQATVSLTSQYSFTRVVFIEWPREGMVAMGFVTGRAYAEANDQAMAIVYIPTVPNPTSGNLAFVVEDDLVETDLSVEDAMRLVFSGGIVLPDSVVLARLPRERDEGELTGRFIRNPD
jgi:uncharacterized membrane protein